MTSKAVFPKFYLFCQEDTKRTMANAIFKRGNLMVTDGHCIVIYPLKELDIDVMSVDVDFNNRFISYGTLKLLAGTKLSDLSYDEKGIHYKDKIGVIRTLEWEGVINQETREMYDNDFNLLGKFPDIDAVIPADDEYTTNVPVQINCLFAQNLVEVRQANFAKSEVWVKMQAYEPTRVIRCTIAPFDYNNFEPVIVYVCPVIC